MSAVEFDGRPIEDVELPGEAPRSPRHPAQLTSARLVDHMDKYAPHLTPAELAAINLSVLALDQVPAREQAARRAGVVDRG